MKKRITLKGNRKEETKFHHFYSYLQFHGRWNKNCTFTIINPVPPPNIPRFFAQCGGDSKARIVKTLENRSFLDATFVAKQRDERLVWRKFLAKLLPCLVKSESMKENNFTADKGRKGPAAGNRDVARGLDGRKWKFKSSLNVVEASNPLSLSLCVCVSVGLVL